MNLRKSDTETRTKVATAALLGAALAFASGPAAAQSFNQFIGFGDSTIDSGSFRILTSPGAGATYNSLWLSGVAAGAGKPTTSPGAVSSEALAALFGLSAIPSDQDGTNFATSGSKNVTINDSQTGGFQAAIPTTVQIADYLASTGGRANPNALYLISSGGNDVAFATGNSGSGPFPTNPQAYIQSAASSLVSSVAALQAAGARFIVVPDLPFSFPGNDATVRAGRLQYSQALWFGLAQAGVNFIPVDFNAMRVVLQNDGSLFGFQFVDNVHTACTQPLGVSSSWALLCSSNPNAPSTLVAANAEQTYLFADDEHLTTAGQKMLADFEYSVIVAPSEISFLAEAPVKTRASMIDSVFNQIAISERQRRPGTFNVWVTGAAASLAMNSGFSDFPNDPGVPTTVTGGIDYAVANGLLIGAAASYDHTVQSFSLGGNFKQDEIVGSIYGALNVGPYWGQIIGSYGGQRYDVDRIVPIGITLQPNTGSTSGRNVSLAAEFGYNFITPLGAAPAPAMPTKAPAPTPWPQITHGPVIGIVLQHVTVDGFTETDQFASIGGFTALSYGDQTRNSAVSELGYQASIDLGLWHPFAKLVWNHELADTNRLVTAALTTTAAPPYALPAVILGRDWGTATVGTTLALAQGVTGYASFFGQVGEQNAFIYGGQVGLNVALH